MVFYRYCRCFRYIVIRGECVYLRAARPRAMIMISALDSHNGRIMHHIPLIAAQILHNACKLSNSVSERAGNHSHRARHPERVEPLAEDVVGEEHRDRNCHLSQLQRLDHRQDELTKDRYRQSERERVPRSTLEHDLQLCAADGFVVRLDNGDDVRRDIVLRFLVARRGLLDRARNAGLFVVPFTRCLRCRGIVVVDRDGARPGEVILCRLYRECNGGLRSRWPGA